MSRHRNLEALLSVWESGDRQVVGEVVTLAYEDLCALARSRLREEGSPPPMQPPELVHEVYLRLSARNKPRWRGVGHFFAVASLVMRRVLIDHARNNRTAKRGGGRREVPLEQIAVASPRRAERPSAVDEALQSLAEHNIRQAQVVELRFFRGLTIEETAKALQVAPVTVARDWRLAKGWLHQKVRRPRRDPATFRPEGGALPLPQVHLAVR